MICSLIKGQSIDDETGLAYNRFRYYSATDGMYVSQDPIGLMGGLNTYAYVKDTNGWIDVFGLAPLTGVDFTGSPSLFPTTGTQRNIVTIKLTGDRGSDFTRAYKEAGISASDAADYTWHHMDNFNPKTGESGMQLVKTSAHKASLPHKGSAGQFADYFGVEYDMFEAKMKAHEQGWRTEPKKINCPK